MTKPLVKGDVFVVQGEVNPLIGSPVQMAGSDDLAAESEVRLPVSPIDYDIRFTTSDNFWLRNRI